ncbi:MAG: tetratricopeptide repeat protein, partial [Candidatus Moranbacteria bacterium]|nr:tetratricopeptide repeat protein [Candidatus Moranbacteria bacterium]
MKNALFLMLWLPLFLAAKADHVADSIRLVLYSDTISEAGKLAAYIALTDRLVNLDFDEARKVYIEAIDYAHSIGNVRYESVFNIRLGTTYYYRGDYHITAKYWLEALRVSENAGDTSRIEQALNNLGILYKTMEEYDTSLKYFSKSLEMKLLTAGAESIAITKMNIGVLYHKMNLHDSAFFYLSPTIKIFEETSNKKALALTYNNLGAVYLAKQNYSDAYQYYKMAYDLKDQLPTYNQAVLFMNLGSLLIHHLDNLEKGKEYLDMSLEYANATNNLRAKQNVHEVYSYYYYLKGDFKNAYEYLELYTAYKDTLLNQEKDAEIKRLQTIYDFEKKEQENLALSQQMEILNQEMIIKDLERQKSVQATQLMGGILFLGIIILTIISILLNKVRKAKHKLETAQDELKITNQYLQKAKEAMEQALDFKSQFLANMSHEVRTPLNVIIGLNSFMKKKITDP